MTTQRPSSFTQYWLNDTWDREVREGTSHIKHTACNQFRRANVKQGDYIYIVTIKDGRLYVAGWIRVDAVLSKKAAANHLRTRNLWVAKDHAIVAKSSYCDFQRKLSLAQTRQLRFEPSSRPLTFAKGTNRLDGQTLRGVRKLTDASARVLAAFVEGNLRERIKQHRSAKFLEGGILETKLERIERHPRARAECLAAHGYACQVCGSKMEEIYGPIGKGLIHVHHVKPLRASKKRREVDSSRDLVPVCPNCHAILHRSNPPMAIQELKRRIRKRRS